jgi:hypothetical protein
MDMTPAVVQAQGVLLSKFHNLHSLASGLHRRSNYLEKRIQAQDPTVCRPLNLSSSRPC